MNREKSAMGCLTGLVGRGGNAWAVIGSLLVVVATSAGCENRPPLPYGSTPDGTPKGAQLFFDDFETGDLRSWTPIVGNWQVPPQVPQSDRAGKQYGTLNGALNVTMAGSAAWTNYAVTARVILGADGSTAGVLGRVQGKHSYYQLTLGPDVATGEKKWFLRLRNGHGTWTPLAAGSFAYEPGVPYVLRMVLDGSRIAGSVSHDEGRTFTTLGHAVDATWAAGMIGLTASGREVVFDDVSVAGELLAAPPSGPWGWLSQLRDDTTTFTSGKPAGGWYVTPIHATLMPRTGKVLITGFGRKAEADCPSGTTRQNGTTFLLDPNAVDSDVEYITPINEQNNPPSSDVLYCAGHNSLADGRIFYSGGTRYTPALPNNTSEVGLDYTRTYDFNTGAFTRNGFAMQGGAANQTPKGRKWYPTNLRLTDGTMLMFGGFSTCCSEYNRSLELFDQRKADLGQNPYTLQVDHSQAPTDTHTILTYTTMFVLPKPINAASGNGYARPVFMLGSSGHAYLYSHEPGTPTASRHFGRSTMPAPTSVNGTRADRAATAMLADGRVFVANGSTDQATASSFRIYDPMTDTWTANTPLGIVRAYGDAVLLPDGTIMLINGDQDSGSVGDRRSPQIINPATGAVTTLPAWPDPEFRGYHAIAVLLKDGRILIGGGRDHHHATACERADVQIFEPPYLALSNRPAITNVSEGQSINPGGAPFTVTYSGGPVRATAGVVLMAPTSMTHAFDVGQRYVPLAYTQPSAGTLSVTPPANINVAPPGDYMMFVIGQNGAISTGVWVTIPLATCLYAVNGDTAITYIEAERASRSSGPFTTITDAARSAGAYSQVTEGSGSHTSSPDEGKVMWYDLDVTNGGNLNLWFLTQGPNGTSDSFWVSVDGGPDTLLTIAATWGWVRAGSSTFSIPTGRHSLKVKVREDGARIDKIALTKSTATPVNTVAAITCGCLAETNQTFCARVGKNCGTVAGTDNCGAARTVTSCGTCASPQSCGGGGSPNMCGGCSAETDAAFCARYGANCGTLMGTDNCGLGRTVASCGTCVSPSTCGATTPNVCSVMGGGLVPDGTYRSLARHSGKALDVFNNATGEGSNVNQWTYGGGTNQRWTLTHLGGNVYKIVGVQSGKALEVASTSTANGTNVDIRTYTGANNQKWLLSATSGGYYRLSPVSSPGSALDVNGVSTADGANVQIWAWTSGNNQQWNFLAP